MVVDVALFALALAGMLVMHVRTARKYDDLLRGVTERTEDRDRALQKQAKAHARQAARTDAAAARAIDAANAALDRAAEVREDTRALQGTFNTMLSDPRLQRFLNREGGG